MHMSTSQVGSPLVHPVGDNGLLTNVYLNYNAYVKTGDLTGGTGANAFTSLVPFENNSPQNSALRTLTASNAGPTASERVSCFSCHRAHASGFDSIARWSNGNEFLTVAGGTNGTTAVYPDKTANAGQAMGRTAAETQWAYGGRDASVWAAPYQRSLCNKCHIKD